MVSAGSLTHIWFILLLVKTTHGVNLDITLTGDPLIGTTITLTCNIPSFTQSASWKNSVLSSGGIQSCTAAFCLATNPSYPGYTFTTNSSAFTVVISSAVLDDNIWTCEHDTAADSGTKTLNLKVAPTTCTLVKSGDTYTCTSSCGYPADDMSIRAKLNGTSKMQDLTPLTNVSTPACTSPESAYSANVPTSFFTQSADLYCECGVSGYESTFVQSNALAVTGTTTPSTTPSNTTHATPKPPCSCSWLPCGWQCHYLYIMIGVPGGGVIVVVIVVVGYRYRRGYFGKNKEEDRKKSYTNKAFDKNDTENGQPTDSPKHTAL